MRLQIPEFYKEQQQILVYYGFEIIEIVPDDIQSAIYELLLGAISKAGENT